MFLCQTFYLIKSIFSPTFPMNILFDYQAFELQQFGGISHSYTELIYHIQNCGCKCKLGIIESDNIYLKENALVRNLRPLNYTHNLFF